MCDNKTRAGPQILITDEPDFINGDKNIMDFKARNYLTLISSLLAVNTLWCSSSPFVDI